LPKLWDQYELTHQLQDLTYHSYTLDAGDKILIRVDGRQPASHEVTVDPQGTITYPRLGRINVAGLTLPELDQSLGGSLSANARKPPKVTTTITEYRDQHVYILGEVRVPGAHPLTPSASLLELITQAGGPTPDAGWLALVIKKNNPSQDHVAPAQPPAKNAGNGTGEQRPQPLSTAIRIDLDELLIGATAQSLRLESGDTIFIPEAAYFFVYGEVERPGRYRLERGMTAIQAISNAGGYTPYAAAKHLKVFRYHVHHEKCGGDLCLWGFARHVAKEPPKEYRLRLHDRLQPADVLIVPAHFGL
jgi:polysaccharide export outer membrane protein